MTDKIKYAGEEAVSRIADYVNKKLTYVSVMPTSPIDGQTVIYMGTDPTEPYLRGGVYEYDDATSAWYLRNLVQTKELTQEEYDALEPEEKENGTIYFITDQDYLDTYELTQAEYNALTPEEQYSGTIYFVTDAVLPGTIVQGYYNELDGEFYEDSSHTKLIAGLDQVVYVSIDTNILYRYDVTEGQYEIISGAEAAPEIVHVPELPGLPNVENKIYMTGFASQIIDVDPASEEKVLAVFPEGMLYETGVDEWDIESDIFKIYMSPYNSGDRYLVSMSHNGSAWTFIDEGGRSYNAVMSGSVRFIIGDTRKYYLGDALNHKIENITPATVDQTIIENSTNAVAGGAVFTGLADKQDVLQYATMPIASSDLVGTIYQYVGTTTGTYTNGYFYKCVSDGAVTPTYSWEQVDVQPVPQEIIEGYYKESDGKFYEDSSYTTEITGEAERIYVSLDTNLLYRYDETASEYAKVGGQDVPPEIVQGYYNETDGKFYEEASYTTEITGDEELTYVGLNTNRVYRYDDTRSEFISLGALDAIQYVYSVPTSDIEDVIYGIVTRTGYSETVADNFLDSNELFEKTVATVGYTYTAFGSAELEASVDDTTYLGFKSLAYDGTDWILTYKDDTTDTLADGDTFYYKQVTRLFYAGNKSEQTVTAFAAGGSGGGGGTNYLAGEGISIYNRIISVIPATSASLGGVKPDNSTTIIDANGVISGNYQGGYGVKVSGNEISTKVFVGTQAQWDALSSSQQADYDTVNITDDFNEVPSTPGHIVVNSSGTAFPQRSNLKINGATVTDDSTNDVTVVTPDEYTAGRGIDIDANKEISVEEKICTTFVGTRAEWNALTTAEKAEYELVNITDDPCGSGTIVVDTVAEGNMNACTSSSVYNYVNSVLPDIKVVSYNVDRNIVTPSTNGSFNVPTSFDNRLYYVGGMSVGLGADAGNLIVYYKSQQENYISIGWVSGSTWNANWLWTLNIILIKR